MKNNGIFKVYSRELDILRRFSYYSQINVDAGCNVQSAALPAKTVRRLSVSTDNRKRMGEFEPETNRWSPRCSIAHTFRVHGMQLCKGNDRFSFLRWYAVHTEKAHSERTHQSTIDQHRLARTGTKPWSTGCPTTVYRMCFQLQVEKIGTLYLWEPTIHYTIKILWDRR